MSSITQAWIRGFTRFSSRVDLYNFGRWVVFSMLVGIVAGLGAAFLTWGIDWLSSILLGDVVGFQVPA